MWIHSSFKPIKTTRKMICNGTSAELLTSDLAYSHDFADRHVAFEEDELREIKYGHCESGIRLLCFREASCVKPYNNLKHATFMFPDEEVFIGPILHFSVTHL